MRVFGILCLIAASAAVLVTPAPSAAAGNDVEAIELATTLTVADRECPRFRLINSAFAKTMSGYGIAKKEDLARAMNAADDEIDPDHQLHGILGLVEYQRQRDPSGWCLGVWRRYGPNGTYLRQLVEPR